MTDPMPRKDVDLPPRMPEAAIIAELRAELAQARADAVDIVRNVWGRCEALEDEAGDKLVLLEELTEHEKGFWRGQKVAAKTIRRSTEMPSAVSAPTPPDTWHERRTMLPDGDARAVKARGE